MEDLKRTVAANLVALRTGTGQTQAMLAQSLHYSDKAVSKWERAESLPDVAVLKELAARYGVTVDYLLTEHDGEVSLPEHENRISRQMITVVSVLGIWTLATLIYVIFWILGQNLWMLWLGVLPLTFIDLLVFNSLWNGGRYNRWIVGALVLSLFVLVYGCLHRFHPWQIFLVTVPAELLVFLSFKIRRRTQKPRE